LRVLNRAFDYPMKAEEHAAARLAGGIMQHGYQCGMIWGATLAAGAEAYRLLGPGSQAETRAIITAQRLVESFFARNNHINCIEITGIDRSSSSMQMIMHFLIKGGTINCMRMAVRYARAAFSEINTALSEKHMEATFPPASCSSMLAQKMGISDIHRVMVAGFAGGIGLSGGACGVLGAAIWLGGMNSLREGDGKIDLNDPKSLNTIDKFVKCTGYEFECSKIVGRKFENIGDHAFYLRNGGCSEIIEALSSSLTQDS
jgi:hypothetical protein